jgi:hypothetical protein
LFSDLSGNCFCGGRRKNYDIWGKMFVYSEKFLYVRKNYDMSGKIFVRQEKKFDLSPPPPPSRQHFWEKKY